MMDCESQTDKKNALRHDNFHQKWIYFFVMSNQEKRLDIRISMISNFLFIRKTVSSLSEIVFNSFFFNMQGYWSLLWLKNGWSFFIPSNKLSKSVTEALAPKNQTRFCSIFGFFLSFQGSNLDQWNMFKGGSDCSVCLCSCQWTEELTIKINRHHAFFFRTKFPRPLLSPCERRE